MFSFIYTLHELLNENDDKQRFSVINKMNDQ